MFVLGVFSPNTSEMFYFCLVRFFCHGPPAPVIIVIFFEGVVVVAVAVAVISRVMIRPIHVGSSRSSRTEHSIVRTSSSSTIVGRNGTAVLLVNTM